jgi:uracil-DNA glycosylase family 4
VGLLFSNEGSLDLRANQEDALFHRMGCKACPLRDRPGRIEPTGAVKPLLYFLGEAPGKTEAKERSQFVGESGALIRARIPADFLPKIRWNNIVRSWPENNRTPERPEIEACRPSIIADIEQSKPQAIFGFGGTPLTWVSGFNRITDWRGRRMPVKVGTHTCWYYPMLHPSFLLRQRRKDERDASPTYIGSEDERMFCFDLRAAFADVLASLPKPLVHDAQRAQAGVEIITAGGDEGVRQIAKALEWAAQQPAIGVDYETNCIRPYMAKAKILTAAVGTEKRSIAFPFAHREAQFTKAQQGLIADQWRKFILSKTRKFVHNLSFELEWSATCFGDDLLHAPGWEDSATQASIIDERKGKKTNTGGPFSLEFLCQQYFGFNVKKLSNVDRKDLDGTPLLTVLNYNAIDAKYHLLLGLEQEAEIKYQGLEEVYQLSLRRVPTVVKSQRKGIPVDQAEVKVLQEKYGERIERLEQDIAAIPVVQKFRQVNSRPYNPSSHPDTIEIFYKMLKRRECLVIDKYSKKQKLSADEEILSKIDHPLAKKLLELRHAGKRIGTYVNPLDKSFKDTVIYPDGLLHPNYNTFFAETGRLSADAPNVQNWPKRDDEGKETRRPVAARKGQKFLAFDWGQIQARIIAMFSKDKNFVKALWERYDIHQEWTERLATDYPDRIGGRKALMEWKSKSPVGKKIIKDFRTDIKNQWTFPLFFGAKLESVAGYLNIPVHIVRPHYNAFWKQFAGVYTWQDGVLKFYNEYGYTECLTGRRRHGPMALNQIVNSPVQGTEAEIVCDGWSRLFETKDDELCPELMIHDDLTFVRIEEDRAEEVATKVLDILLTVPFEFVNVPITIELSAGRNWMPYDKELNPEGLEEIGAFSSDTWFAK